MVPFTLILSIWFMSALKLPSITAPSGQWTTVYAPHFFRSTDGSAADYPTKVKIMPDANYLHVDFVCEKDAFVAQNYLHEHNQPLYNQEVFEVFIAAGKEDPIEYLEVEINPNNATWVGRINNPSLGSKNDLKGEIYALEQSQIKFSAQQGKKNWSGSLSIPWTLIGKEKSQHYRLNFYRIVSKKAHDKQDWVCNPDNCEFLCWSATLSGAIPAFHRPRRFGLLTIVE